MERRPLEQAEARGGAERDEQLAVAEGLGDDAVLVVRAVAQIDVDELAEARAAAAGVGGHGDVRAGAEKNLGRVGDDADEAPPRAQQLRDALDARARVGLVAEEVLRGEVEGDDVELRWGRVWARWGRVGPRWGRVGPRWEPCERLQHVPREQRGLGVHARGAAPRLRERLGVRLARPQLRARGAPLREVAAAAGADVEHAGVRGDMFQNQLALELAVKDAECGGARAQAHA